MNNAKKISALLLLIAACYLTQLSQAATIIVTNSNDDGVGTLRDAVASAAGGETITFDPNLNGQTITLTSGEIAISKSLTIEGPGAKKLAVSGNNAGRIFNISAPTTISGLTLKDGDENYGGAILASANVSLTADTFTDNYASISGGAVAGTDASASFTISDSTFSNNRSDFESGALYTAGTANSIARSNFSGNTTAGGGVAGAIFNDGTINIDQTTISNNSVTGDGGTAGAIYSNGSLTLTQSTLSGNRVGNNLGQGGGLYNAGTVTFRNSTISGNSAGDGSQGGGIFNEAPGRMTPTVAVINSTIANNTVGIAGQGGGVYDNSTVTLNNSTIAGNTAGTGGAGGGIYINGATVNAANTIIARDNADTGPDFFGLLASQGYNLIGNTNDSSGEGWTDLINVDPNLAPLQNNGGPTQTMALLPGSPAIDAGDPRFNPNVLGPPMTTDQRNGARVINRRVDIGSFEANVARKPSIDSLTPPQTLECVSHQGANANVTADVSDSQGHSLTVQWFVNNELKQIDHISGTRPATHGSSTYSATFPDDKTAITVTVIDGQDGPASQSTSVTVVDTTPPIISSISANPNVLPPLNHKMLPVTVSVTAADICDPNPTCKIVSVTSNEPGSGEYQITGNLTVNLQAERNGRIYTIQVQCTDTSGNSASKNVTVTVPKGNK